MTINILQSMAKIHPSHSCSDLEALPLTPLSPPVLKSTFSKFKGLLLFLSNILGSLLFAAGCIVAYGFTYGYSPEFCGLISCQFFTSILWFLGCIFFTLAPIATHFLSEVDTERYEHGCGEATMAWKSNLYVIGGCIYIIGSLAYFPYYSFSLNTQQYILTAGASFFVVGSAVYIVAIIRDLRSTRKLKDKSQIPLKSFIIESWVSGLYLLGSSLFLIGSIFCFPAFYTPHMNMIFLIGCLSFFLGSASGSFAQLWQYTQLTLQREVILKYRKAFLESLKRGRCSVQESLLLKRSWSTPNLTHKITSVSQLPFKPPSKDKNITNNYVV